MFLRLKNHSFKKETNNMDRLKRESNPMLIFSPAW